MSRTWLSMSACGSHWRGLRSPVIFENTGGSKPPPVAPCAVLDMATVFAWKLVARTCSLRPVREIREEGLLIKNGFQWLTFDVQNM